jgi:hypothetical protein
LKNSWNSFRIKRMICADARDKFHEDGGNSDGKSIGNQRRQLNT